MPSASSPPALATGRGILSTAEPATGAVARQEGCKIIAKPATSLNGMLII